MAEGSSLMWSAVFGLFIVYSLLDFMGPASTPQANGEDTKVASNKEVPELKYQLNNNEVPQITFLYCVSWGYKNAFQQYAQVLQQHYPDMQIVGDTFRPPFPKAEIAQGLGLMKIFIIMLVVAGINPFTYLNTPTPGMWTWLQSNKVYGSMLIFFISGMIESNLISTGAFEIYLNNEQIWSKITTGRVPEPGELFNIIDIRRQNFRNAPGLEAFREEL